MIHIRHILQRGNTALHDAAANGHLEIATLLISSGCDSNMTTNGDVRHMVYMMVTYLIHVYLLHIIEWKHCTLLRCTWRSCRNSDTTNK